MREESSCEHQLVPYGFSIFTYINQYDQEWKNYVQELRKFLFAVKSVKQPTIPLTNAEGHAAATTYVPDESIYLIMSYLDDRDLCIAGSVNRSWFRLANQDELWNNLLQKKFTVSSSDIVMKSNRKRKSHNAVASKLIYVEMYHTLRGVLEGMQGPKMKPPTVPASLLYYTSPM